MRSVPFFLNPALMRRLGLSVCPSVMAPSSTCKPQELHVGNK